MANKSRPKQLSFRVSEEEYQQLQEKISKSGKNQQEYILSCVLEKQIVNTDGIKELIPELKRIGNNLNQIAKRCNEGGMLPSEAEVRKHGEELNKVWQSLRRYRSVSSCNNFRITRTLLATIVNDVFCQTRITVIIRVFCIVIA